MKIKMKRLFGIMLSLVLVLGLMPVNSLTAYAGNEGGTGTGTYSATLVADSAVNSNNLSLEISFSDTSGGNPEKHVVTIYPEKGERTGSDSGNIPEGAKSVELKVVTAGNLVDFSSSSISINGTPIMHSRRTRGDRHSSRVEATNPALLSSRDGYLLELTGWMD